MAVEIVKAGANVLHIDHHKTTKEFMQNATKAQLNILNKITKFYDTTRSASMLTVAGSVSGL